MEGQSPPTKNMPILINVPDGLYVKVLPQPIVDKPGKTGYVKWKPLYENLERFEGCSINIDDEIYDWCTIVEICKPPFQQLELFAKQEEPAKLFISTNTP